VAIFFFCHGRYNENVVIKDEKLIEEALSRAVERAYPSKGEVKKALLSGKKLRIYLGVDPTAPHLHFGHGEQLLALRRFQKLGHEIIFLIGDFTARIGDPTDKSAARVPLTSAEVKANLRTFKKQAAKIIKFAGVFGGGAKIKFNSEWLAKMDFSELIKLAQKFTVQQMIERDMFQGRIKAEKPVGVHEFLYPLMQGYDSVAMDVDMEIGGNDQTFNMLAGRALQKIYNKKEKFVLATKLLVNPKTGKKLMSKSEGGTINLDDSAKDIFGKTMALEDDGMFLFAECSTEMPVAEIKKLEIEVSSGKMNPRDAKLAVAEAATALIYGEAAGQKEKENFLKIFSQKEIPADTQELTLTEPEISVVGLVLLSGVAESRSEARRLIEQGALEVGGRIEKDIHAVLLPQNGETIRIGKKYFARVKTRE
jgi:tyrosyl-tRNA synthetase